MAQCPKCKSTQVEVSQSVVNGSMALGAQVGSIIGGALAVGVAGPLALVGLLVGGALGGWGGAAAGNAIDPRWKHVCRNCGCTWKN